MAGKKKLGRPSVYTQDVADEICERIANGESTRSICRDSHMPSQATVFRWLADEGHRLFREQYERARETQADALFEEILEIADDASNDWMEAKGDKAGEGWKLNGEHVQRSRLRVDTRKWAASKLKPKKYGDRIQQEHSGDVGVTVQLVSFADDADDQEGEQ